MTKADLLKAIVDVPDDTLIVMSRDSEGNDYSPLAQIDEALYRAENTYSGELYDEDQGEEEKKKCVPCIVLWPTN